MKIDIPVHTITMKEEVSGEHTTITILRTVTEIADMLDEIEREIIDDKITEKVAETLAQTKSLNAPVFILAGFGPVVMSTSPRRVFGLSFGVGSPATMIGQQSLSGKGPPSNQGRRERIR